MKKFRKNKKGFTLTEIIVVLVILAILAAATIPTMLNFVEEARGKAMIAEIRTVYLAAQARATEKVAVGGDFDPDLASADVAKILELSELGAGHELIEIGEAVSVAMPDGTGEISYVIIADGPAASAERAALLRPGQGVEVFTGTTAIADAQAAAVPTP